MADRPGRAGPKYRHIADELRGQIASGKYKPGDRLPSKAALVKLYGGGVNTVERAVEVLRQEGLVESLQGAGMFVLKAPEAAPDVSAQLAELRAEVGELRQQVSESSQALESVGRIEANLMDLYGKLGYEYPGNARARPKRKVAGS